MLIASQSIFIFLPQQLLSFLQVGLLNSIVSFSQFITVFHNWHPGFGNSLTSSYMLRFP